MKAGDIVELTISSLAFGGAGVGRINDFVVFVPFTLEGENVRAQILKVKSNYAEAKPLEILMSSPLRITPQCHYFGQCGGCVYQHMPYDKQLELKTRQIREVYKQITGGVLDCIEETCPSPKPYNYRTKIRMKLKLTRQFSKFGYFDYYENFLLDMAECPIASEALNQHLQMVRAEDFSFFRNKKVFSWNYSLLDTAHGVIDNLGPNIETRQEVAGKIFHYTRETFFQSNHSIFKVLFDTVHEVLKQEQVSFESLLDLYCGVGFFGIILSDYFKKVYFIEENKASHKLLLKNIEANGLKDKAITLCASADKAVKMLNHNPEVVLMDPPRIGSSPESILQIVSMNPKVIIYVSCNPATQFRDAIHFEKNGYRISHLKPFDFFPHTKHVESMAIFRK